MTDEKTFGSPGEEHIAAARIDRCASSAQTLERFRQLVERMVVITGSVLDRKARNAGIDAQGDALGDRSRRVAIARLEVGVDRKRCCLDQLADVFKHELPAQ